MDPTYLVGLAEAGALALVTAMATDAWAGIRSGAARVLAGGDDADREAAAGWLDRTRESLLAVPVERQPDAVATLRSTLDELLRARLAADPTVGVELAEIVRRVDGGAGPSGPGSHQHAQVIGGSHVYQAGRDIRISGGRRNR
ncbi:hypothetical protein [Polymorphospora sp. NPDC050346]|uniref:hypothetical protein n=1 Tax=Polymorphospora sp. NPDC050346 TaxID=3155780 RepID=UPI0033FC1929